MIFKPFTYNSLEEFLTDVENTPAHKLASSNRYGGWEGAKSFAHASEIVRGGVDLSKVDMKVKEFESVGTMQMDSVHDVSGAVVDMGAYLEGIPENMIDFPLIDNKKFIQVFVNTCEHSGVGAEEIVNKAAAIAYLIDHLESEKNYRVELSVVYPVKEIDRKTQENHMINVKIKGFQEKLSIGQVYGCMAPCFQRVMMFRHNEKYTTAVNYGYGSVDTDYIAAIKTVADPSIEIIYLPNVWQSSQLGHPARFSTNEGAMEWANYFMEHKVELNKKTNA